MHIRSCGHKRFDCYIHIRELHPVRAPHLLSTFWICLEEICPLGDTSWGRPAPKKKLWGGGRGNRSFYKPPEVSWFISVVVVTNALLVIYTSIIVVTDTLLVIYTSAVAVTNALLGMHIRSCSHKRFASCPLSCRSCSVYKIWRSPSNTTLRL